MQHVHFARSLRGPRLHLGCFLGRGSLGLPRKRQSPGIFFSGAKKKNGERGGSGGGCIGERGGGGGVEASMFVPGSVGAKVIIGRLLCSEPWVRDTSTALSPLKLARSVVEKRLLWFLTK